MTEWSSADLAILQELAARGASATRVAARLGRSVTAVKKRANEIGVVLKNASEVRKQGGLDENWVKNRPT